MNGSKKQRIRNSRHRSLRVEACETRCLLAGPDGVTDDASTTNASQAAVQAIAPTNAAPTNAAPTNVGLTAALDPAITNEGRIERLFASNQIPIVAHENAVGTVAIADRAQTGVGLSGSLQAFINPFFRLGPSDFDAVELSIPSPPPLTPSISSLPIDPSIIAGSIPAEPSPPPEEAASSSDDASRSAELPDAPLDVVESDPPTGKRLLRGEGGVEPLVASVAVRAIPIASDRLSVPTVPSHIAHAATDAIFREQFLNVQDVSHLAAATPAVTNQPSVASVFATPNGGTSRDTSSIELDSERFSGLTVAIRGPEVPLMFEHDTYQFVTTSVRNEAEATRRTRTESPEPLDLSHTTPESHPTPLLVSAMLDSVTLRSKTHPAALLLIVGVLLTQKNHRLEKYQANRQQTHRLRKRLTD